MKKDILILDIKKKHKIDYLDEQLSWIENKNLEIVSLTPFSSYLLSTKNINYKTFHDLCSIEFFRELVLKKYNKLNEIENKFLEFSYIFRDIMRIISYEVYIYILNNYLLNKEKNLNITYMTDTKKLKINMQNIFSNQLSLLHYNKNINNIIIIDDKDDKFYKQNKLVHKIKTIYNKSDIFKTIKNKILRKKQFSYDNSIYSESLESINNNKLKKINIPFYEFKEACLSILCVKSESDLFPNLYKILLSKFEEDLKKDVIGYTSNLFTYLSENKNYVGNMTLKYNKINRIFTQHGSYLYNHFFYKNCEITPSDINFVSNEYTKKLFKSLNSKKVYNVGSIVFNKKILDKKKKFDYLYITYNTNYSGNGNYIESNDCQHSMDGDEIYNRHKAIINLFGKKLKNKTICIKMQAGIFTDSLLYIPLIELSENFTNIIIEFSTPIHKLIEKSKYIISDYFSSEFINRELHYKRDILLFLNGPLSLPLNTIEDMKKMFILVDTVEDLNNKINDIETITKNRERDEKIIEYYSSRKCDTKKVVSEIIEKEINGR